MNPTNIIEGFSILAQSVRDSNQATIDGLNNLEQRLIKRIDRNERRIDCNELRMNYIEQRIERIEQCMDIRLKTIIALINKAPPSTK